jgi:hypothetical protein
MRQRILVTGTSSGLSMLTAARLAEAGCAVVASMRTPAKSNALRAELDRRKTTAEVLELGVTSPESVTNAMAHLEQLAGSTSSSTMQAFRVRVSWSIWTTKRSRRIRDELLRPCSNDASCIAPIAKESESARDQRLESGGTCRLPCWEGVFVKQMGRRGLLGKSALRVDAV